MPDPSADPDRTAVRSVSVADPITVDRTADSTDPHSPDSPAGVPVILGYRVIAEIAKGGMGRVYAAVDLTLDREVAIKTLLPAADPTRFVTESKITAKLPHPGIPPVHALGTLADGTPFLAMKLIRGQTLSEQLKARPTPQHDLPRFVQVFEQIAQAVGFAHSRGVIHRDLKPLNVMVGEFGEVQVMDWGLAREMRSAELGSRNEDSQPAGATSIPHSALPVPHLTQAGAIMGTPAYMAPEQARGEPVDARADVFALGATLAAILTGKPAFVGTTVQETVAKAANADLADVLARLDGCGADADLIVLARRCLAADRDARPADGRAVADEVAAYRAGVEDRLRQAETERAEAVVREGEQRKRRRVIAWASGVVAAVLLAGLGVSLWQMDRAIAAEKQAVDERDAKDVALQSAETNLGYARKGNDLLGSVFTGLDPKAYYATVADLRNALKDNLKKAVKELDGSAIGDPLEVAKMQNTLGASLLGLGEAKLAIAVLEKALDTREARLGRDHPDTLQIMNNLAACYREAGWLERALPLYEETLQRHKAWHSSDYSGTLGSLNNLGEAYKAAGNLDRAIELLEEAHTLLKAQSGTDLALALTCMNNLGCAYRDAGKLDRGMPLLEESLRLTKAVFGPDHRDTLNSMQNLARGYQAAEQFDRALPMLEETVRLMKVRLGPDHPDTLSAMGSLGQAYSEAGKLDLALPLLEETVRLKRARLGIDHPETLSSTDNLAGAYEEIGKHGQALPLYEEAFKGKKDKLGTDHPSTLNCMNNLAHCYSAMGKLDQALPLWEEAVRRTEARLGPSDPLTLTTLNNLAVGYSGAKKHDRAIPLFEETLKRSKAKLGPDHPDTLTNMNDLATSYRSVGRPDLALPLLEDGLKLRKARHGPDHPDTLTSMNNLAACYWLLNRTDRSVTLLEELLPIHEKKLGRGHPDTLLTVGNLGVNYKDAGQVTEAIPLLEEASRASRKFPKLQFARQALLDAYSKAGKPADAAKLIDELLAEARKSLPKDSPQLAGRLAQFGLTLLVMKGFTEAEPLLRECLAIREKTQPQAWATFNTMSLLGGALLGQKKYADAEPLLLKGYEGMKVREKTIPPTSRNRIPEALDRLIELYTATNKSAEVAKCKELRAAYREVLPAPRRE